MILGQLAENVCMNTYISINIRATTTKFGIHMV